MDAGEIILSRGLPKTGQAVQYRIGDDGIKQFGWWQGLKIANNKTRFIAKTVNDNDIVIDLATGLMWAADGNEIGCNNGQLISWNNAIDYCLITDFAGFTDWRLPNIKELMSIINYGLKTPAVKQPPFANTKYDKYWSSTTYRPVTTNAWHIDFNSGIVYQAAKTTSYYLRCVRGGG